MKHDDTTLQAAIDAALIETETNVCEFAACPKTFPKSWAKESPARLALAKTFLAKLPEPQPILADDGRSLGQVALDAGNVVQKIRFPGRSILTWKEVEDLHDILDASAQAVANVVLSQAIRRMEAVPVENINEVFHQGISHEDCLERIRARLIAAARGPINLEAAVGATPGSFAKTCDDPKTGELPMSEIPWIEWHGGECPLDITTVAELEYKMRNGRTDVIKPPMVLDWTHYPDAHSFEVIAYRVLKWRESCGPDDVEAQPILAAARDEEVGINGLTEAEEAQTANVAGLSKPDSTDWKAKYEQAEAERKKWEEDALRYCKNADYWKARAEKAEEEVAALKGDMLIAERAVDNVLKILPEMVKSPSWEDAAITIREHIDKLQKELTEVIARAEKAESDAAVNYGMLLAARDHTKKAEAELAAIKSSPIGILRPLAEAMRCVTAVSKIEDLVTTDHETKNAFIARVRGILGHNDLDSANTQAVFADYESHKKPTP